MADKYGGIDIGSRATKAVAIDGEGKIIGSYVCPSGIDYPKAAGKALDAALGVGDWRDIPVVVTGYWRRSVDFAAITKTEIACHARGAYSYFPRAMTLIDIGGQDNKVIRLDDDGKRLDFKMNRKCAAGTGTFIEEIAGKMGIPLEEMNDRAARAEKQVRINSYCTVFASTEILGLIRTGISVEELARGVFESVAERVMEMVSPAGFTVLCGGVVAHNPLIADIFSQKIKGEVVVSPQAQFTGAYGAALFARESAD